MYNRTAPYCDRVAGYNTYIAAFLMLIRLRCVMLICFEHEYTSTNNDNDNNSINDQQIDNIPRCAVLDTCCKACIPRLCSVFLKSVRHCVGHSFSTTPAYVVSNVNAQRTNRVLMSVFG
jgi:hypothetical protein